MISDTADGKQYRTFLLEALSRPGEGCMQSNLGKSLAFYIMRWQLIKKKYLRYCCLVFWMQDIASSVDTFITQSKNEFEFKCHHHYLSNFGFKQKPEPVF